MTQNDDETYTLAFNSPIPNQHEFDMLVNEHLLTCLNASGGSLVDSFWETQSIRLKLKDLKAFQVCLTRRYIFVLAKPKEEKGAGKS